MQFLHQPWASQWNMAGLSWPLIFPPTRSILILNFFACQDIIFMSHILSGISWVLQANMTKAFNSSTTVGNMLGLSNTGLNPTISVPVVTSQSTPSYVSLSNIWHWWHEVILWPAKSNTKSLFACQNLAQHLEGCQTGKNSLIRKVFNN